MGELKGKLSVPAEIPFDYVIREASGEPRELVLLLHGYSQSGAPMLRKLSSVIPENAVALAPNAPFPFAERVEEKYRMAYSWYFYNFQTDEYVVDMATSLQFLEAGIERLGYSNLPLRIVGFSQGGYLAPFLGQKLRQTAQVIGVCSTFLYEEIEGALPFRVDNVVGAQDEIVDPVNSEKSHRELVRRSKGGEFFSLPVGHRIDEQVARKIGDLLRV